MSEPTYSVRTRFRKITGLSMPEAFRIAVAENGAVLDPGGKQIYPKKRAASLYYDGGCGDSNCKLCQADHIAAMERYKQRSGAAC